VNSIMKSIVKRFVKTVIVKTMSFTLIAAPLWLGACAEMFNPPDKVITGKQASLLNPDIKNFTFTRIPLSSSATPVTVCCTAGNPGSNIVDGSASSFWGTDYGNWNGLRDRENGLHIYYGPHWAVIDLGQIYNNITRIEYIPIWSWNGPGGYDGSWSGGPAGVRNNGLVTGFEIYISETPFPDNQYPPSEAKVAQGNWYALEDGSNTKITTSQMEFFATFNSARGRYLQFRITAGYRNHWESYLSALGQIAELRIWRTDKPYAIYMQGLKDTLQKVEYLRSTQTPRYGYTNAMLRYWVERAQRYLDNPDSVTQEVVDYAYTNMDNFLKLSSRRSGMETYNRFIQKIIWADDNGSHLSAHGGGTMWDPVSQKWWFYGEDRTSWGSDMTGGGQPGVHAYSSKDMYNWKDEGLALPIFNNTKYDEPDWREDKSVNLDGFPGGWDGNRRNIRDFGWTSGAGATYPMATSSDPHVDGFMWAVNKWRQSLGDWRSIGDHGINPNDPENIYPNGTLTGHSKASVSTKWSLSTANKQGPAPLPIAIQNERWAAISKYFPAGNPSLYVQDNNARPFAVSMGLNQAKINELNSLYRDTPVWRKKQLYRFWNHTTTVERPKVIFNAGGSKHQFWNTGNHPNGKPIKPYEDSTGVYPYVMFVHIEGGAVAVSYGTCKVLIAVAKNPAGPFKVLWAYHTHFVPSYYRGENANNPRSTDHMGMSRDQNVMVDDDGVAYHFGSTLENRIMGINMLNETYTQIVGVPRFAVGESQDQMIEEGYDGQLGRNFNWVYGNQREAPAPFIFYNQSSSNGVTYEGQVNANGTLTPLTTAQRNTKFYFMASSTSTGWFPNTQGIYRTSRAFTLGNASGRGYILGRPGHDGPGTDYGSDGFTTTDGEDPTDGRSGSGWVAIRGNDQSQSGGNGTFFFGAADDGSIISKGYDGQTTNVQQLRYPPYVWDIVGFWDDDYVEPDIKVFNTPQKFLEELRRLYGLNADGTRPSNQSSMPIIYRKPIYGSTSIPELRVGKLVPGKYIHMSDSWDNTKNYDARYIWLPMRVVYGTDRPTESTNGRYGARARWMKEWRWQDFVYNLGPFQDSLNPSPGNIPDSVNGPSGSPSMWSNNGRPQNLADYYEMLNKWGGDSSDLYLNPGKQNPGQDWLKIWNQ